MTGNTVDALRAYPETAIFMASLPDTDTLYAFIDTLPDAPKPDSTRHPHRFPPYYVDDPDIRKAIKRKIDTIEVDLIRLKQHRTRANVVALKRLAFPLDLFGEEIAQLERDIAWYQRFLKKPSENPDLDVDKARQILIHSILGIPDPQNRNISCPFHTDKHPSARCYQSPPRFHCYSCGEHLDSIALYQKLYKTSFPQTVKALCGM